MRTLVYGGVEMDFDTLKNWENWTLDDLYKEKNAEKFRVMVEFYGIDRFLYESNAKITKEDICGKLYTLDFDGDQFTYVCVVNQTKEPGAEKLSVEEKRKRLITEDNYKLYFIEVPSNIEWKSAKQAVAWTGGLTEEGDDLDVES